MGPEVHFVRLLATLLHQYGTAAHRLEGAVSAAAEQLGLQVEVFSTPTSVFLSFADSPEDHANRHTELVRLSPGQIDVGRLAVLDDIAERVGEGSLSLEDGLRELRAVRDMEPVAPLWGQLLAWAAVGVTVAGLLGSTWTDLGSAALLALVTGALTLRVGGRWREAGSFEPIVAFAVTVAAYLLARLAGGGEVPNVVIAALIILMPGLDLTIAITELSTGHLASGTARFAGATVVLFKLALGVMIATQLMHGLGFAEQVPTDPALYAPRWLVWVMLVGAGFAFAVLFNAQLRDWPAVVLAAMLAFFASDIGTSYLGTEAGVFIAALLVAAASNVYGRLVNRPSSIMRLPGIILLVPGSLGYRALTFLFSRNINEGIEAAVSVAVVLAALVGGLLLGNTLVVPRRNL